MEIMYVTTDITIPLVIHVIFSTISFFYLNYMVPSIGFQTFCTGIYNCRRLLKIHCVIAIHLMR